MYYLNYFFLTDIAYNKLSIYLLLKIYCKKYYEYVVFLFYLFLFFIIEMVKIWLEYEFYWLDLFS